MAKTIQLKVQARTDSGTVAAKALRKTGQVPAVIYGRHQKPQSLQLSARDIKAALAHATGEHLLVDLEIANGENTLALIQDVQHHAVKQDVLHVDFLALKADETMHTTVPVESFGEALGVKNGGILDHPLRSIEVECLPKDLPDTLTIDVAALNIGDSVHVKDLPIPAGVTVLTDGDVIVFHVVAPTVEAEPVAGEATTEPEVLKEKKPEGGDAAAKGDAKKPEAKKPEGKK